MTELPEVYRRLIAKGIDKRANLPDLNDLTDRGRDGKIPLKPWTAAKTAGTISLIKQYNVRDEETLFRLFQEKSKVRIEDLVDQVYEYQLYFFGNYRYSKEVIFKYAYCCIVVNSLAGNTTEEKFDRWAKAAGIRVRNAPSVLDEKYHTDRVQLSASGEISAFLSVKPKSFEVGCLKYSDVFSALQLLSDLTGLPWKIYCDSHDGFKLISLSSFSHAEQIHIKRLPEAYSAEEQNNLKQILDVELGLVTGKQINETADKMNVKRNSISETTLLAWKAFDARDAGDFESAIEIYNGLIQNDPADWRRLWDRGVVYLISGIERKNPSDLKRAIEDFNQSIRIEPKFDNAYYNRGLAFSELKDYKAAIEDFNRSIEVNNGHLKAYVERSRAQLEAGLYREAEEGCNHVVSLYDLWLQLQNEKGPEAEELKRKVQSTGLKIRNLLPVVYILRGRIRAALKDYQAAMKDFASSIEIRNDLGEAWYRRGNLKRELGDIIGALNDYSNAVRLSPQSTDFLKSAAIAEFESGDVQKADETIGKAIGIDAADDALSMVRAAFRLKTADPEGALEDLCRASEINPRNGGYFLKIGDVKKQIGDTAGACAAWSKAGELGELRAYDLIRENCKNPNALDFL